MKHVPSVLAAKAQGQLMRGVDGRMYQSQKCRNKTIRRWRWVRIGSEAWRLDPSAKSLHETILGLAAAAKGDFERFSANVRKLGLDEQSLRMLLPAPQVSLRQ